MTDRSDRSTEDQAPRATRRRRLPLTAAPAAVGKEHAGASEEEGHGGEGPQGRTPEAAQARRGSGDQGRLATLAAPWWTREHAWLSEQIARLEQDGFRVEPFDRPGYPQELLIRKGVRLYIAAFRADFTPGMNVDMTVRALEPGEVDRVLPTCWDIPAAIREFEAGLEPGIVLMSPLGPKIFLPADGLRFPSAGHGTFEVGQARGSGAYAVLTVRTLAPESDVWSAGLGWRDRFPDHTDGYWATGELPNLTVIRPEVVVSEVERALATAHGTTPKQMAKRLRTSFGALAERGPYGAVLIVHRTADGTPVVVDVEVFYRDSFVARASHATALGHKHVAVVGCGAIGWSVALLLARAGVRRFTLFDPDVVRAVNLPRLGTGIGDIALPKVDALAAQLAGVAPDVRVESVLRSVGIGTGAYELAELRPDLIVDLTAGPSTDATNLAALLARRPAIYGWVSNSVRGARLFRVRPFESACYECVRNARPRPISSNGPVGFTWAGEAYDAELVAAAIARMAVRTLLAERVSPSNPDHAVLRFGGAVPSSRSVRIARDRGCPLCGPLKGERA